MTQVLDWTLDEFRTLLDAGKQPPLLLTQRLPSRTSGGIAFVQHGVHAFHMGKNETMLSKMMVHYLEFARGTVVCPVCGGRL